MQISASLQNAKSSIYLGREVLVGDAEFFDIKLEGLSLSAAHAYLVEVSQMLIDVLYEFFGWEGIIYALA